MSRRILLCLLGVLIPCLPAAAAVVPNRYIVELEGAPAAESLRALPRTRRAAQVASHRSAVRRRQGEAYRRITRLRARVLGSVDMTANALLVEIPDALAARLRQLPRVKRVIPVQEYTASLDRALPLANVEAAWETLGGADFAGAGVKIAVIDSGIDVAHPGFQDPSLPLPDGFPRVNQESDLQYTSNKVIVARSYATLDNASGDTSAMDSNGHGTAVAMAAAGVPHDSPQGRLSGVAPRAWLGNYRASRPGNARTFRSDTVMKAFDDAVADGMDIINLSLGSALAQRPEDDIFTDMVERAATLGVLVVVAAGNEGPDPFTIASRSVAPAALAVGATANARTFGASFTIEGAAPMRAQPGNGPAPATAVTAPVTDVERLDSTGLACDPLPPQSLAGHIAFILRGTCTFEQKLGSARAAGAVGALVYNSAGTTGVITMSVGAARLPAMMVSHTNGLAIKQVLAQGATPIGAMDFSIRAVADDPNRISDFSSRGPSTDYAIKPDLVAAGQDIYTAAPNAMYRIVDGTSFSAPLVAGAAAVLLSARPGLSVRELKSLLVNTAAPIALGNGGPVSLQQTGAGHLNLDAALRSTLAAHPVSLSFGVAGSGTALRQPLVLRNLSTTTSEVLLSVEPLSGSAAPALSTTSLMLAAGGSAMLEVSMPGASLPAGEYQGYIVASASTGGIARIPYWFASPSGVPAHITLLYFEEQPRQAGQPVRPAVLFRVTDSTGVPVVSPAATVSAVTTGAEVLRVYSGDASFPGSFAADVRLSTLPGANVFRIAIGDLSEEFTISGR